LSTIEAASVSSPDEAGVLTPGALDLVVALQREFASRREELLLARAERLVRIEAGELPGFLEANRSVREGELPVAASPPDLTDRRVGATGAPGASSYGARVGGSGYESGVARWEGAGSRPSPG